MTRSMPQVERAAFLALAGCLGLIQNSIAGAEILLDVAGILWLIVVIGERRRLSVPAFFWPLVGLAAWTLVSSAFSMDPFESFKRDRQLLLYLIVPMTMTLARGPRATTTANVIIALGAAGAVVGIVQYAALGYDNLHQRPHGLLGHYMTYSGVLMLVICVAAALLMFRERDWVWPAVAVPALLVALYVTQSRNAYVGVALAIAVLLVLRRAWKLLIVVPVLAAIVVLAGPAGIRNRVFSAIDRNDATNRDRIAMLKSGKAMIADHPLTGVGPNMVPKAYIEKYKTPDAVDPEDKPNDTRAHLHNVPVQLAAERGLPALALWLVFVVTAVVGLVGQFRRGRVRALAAGGVAAIVAMLTAGMFEHNFGDSEFLILFLGVITLPFAAAAPPAAGSRAPSPDPAPVPALRTHA
ncbi:MAG TPA: O-antigen ligase family protein [Vicinamibacterales bacterium]|nr:O-antigen ligase family protein [Vicinamibacterales bacterium]